MFSPELVIAILLTYPCPTASVWYGRASGPVLPTEELFARCVPNIITDEIFVKAYQKEIDPHFAPKDRSDIDRIRKFVSVGTVGKTILVIRPNGLPEREGVRLVNALAEGLRLGVNAELPQVVEKEYKKQLARAQEQVATHDREIAEAKRQLDLTEPSQRKLLENKIEVQTRRRETWREHVVRAELELDTFYRTGGDLPSVRILRLAMVPQSEPRPLP